MKKTIILSAVAIIVIGFFFVFKSSQVISPIGKTIFEKPLEKYTFKRLQEKVFEPSEITLGLKLSQDTDSISSYIFYFKDQGKKVSGLINIPKSPGTYPVVVQFRGFVPIEKYSIGEGTKHSGEVFARNGFITLAPDFLGYGESASPSANSIEERFQTYTTALSLVASLGNLNTTLGSVGSVSADISKVGIWGHSNGGHISLSVLAITGKSYPTVLWNPVTKPFPYSILYFTDEFDDHGKALRRAVAHFEKDYDIELYSPTNYYNWITSPILFQQAVEDEAVPVRWSNQFVEEMKKMKKEIEYITYPGEDHNFSKGSWNSIVLRDIEFFRQQFSK